MRTMLREPIIDIRENGTFSIMEMPKAGAVMLRGNQAKTLMDYDSLHEPEKLENPKVIHIHEGKLPETTFG